MQISQKKPPDQIPAMDGIKAFHLFDLFSAKIETVLNIIGVIFIMLLMILTAAEIIGRYAFNRPIPGYVEDVELIVQMPVYLDRLHSFLLCQPSIADLPTASTPP